MNKKAQNLSVTTIVIIVLAVIVLVVLVLGFTGGWGNLWGRMKGFLGGGPNINSIVQACNVACTTQSKYDFCVTERRVILEDKKKITGWSCYELPVLYTDELSDIGSCDDIECDLACDEDIGWNGIWMAEGSCESRGRDEPKLVERFFITEKNKDAKVAKEIFSEYISEEDKAGNEANECCVVISNITKTS